jgi:tetratricopeptide (TPR) repeat protein
VATFFVYFPVFQNGFLKTWDDNRYIINNPIIQNLGFSNIVQMFSMYYDGHYHPLTLLSLAIDYQVDGLDPVVFHTTNLLLHIGNTLLVFWFVFLLFDRKNLSMAVISALLFGISTMAVESVVWASERKNLLYAFFFFASLVAYLKYLKTENTKYFLFSIFLFLMSLLSKAMALPLVATLIAIDYFYGRKLLSKKTILEKLPFLLLALAFGLVAIFAQKETWGEDLSQEQYSFFQRFLFAGAAFVQYIFKLIVPYKLSGFYPYPDDISGMFLWEALASIVFTIGLLWLFFRSIKRDKVIVFGLLYFMVNIFLLLKLFEFPAGDYIMADRYSYVASVGVFILMAYLFQNLLDKKTLLKKLAQIILIAYFVFLGFRTFQRTSVFQDDLHFYSDIIEKYPTVEVAYTNRGVIRQDKMNLRGALSDFNHAIKLNPKAYKNYANRAAVYTKLNEYKKAKADYEKSHSLKPGNLMVLSNLGYTKLQTGDFNGAIKDFNTVLDKQSRNTEVLNNRGTAKFSLGNFNAAIQDYTLAIGYDSSFVNAWFNRGLANLNSNKLNEAIHDFSTCIKLNPKHVEAYSNRAIAFSRQNNFEKAFSDYDEAIRLKPSYFDAWLNRGVDKLHVGRNAEAVSDFNRAIQINPNVGATYYFRGLALIGSGKTTACSDFQTALKLGFGKAREQIIRYCK